jgi:hypothetical protein
VSKLDSEFEDLSAFGAFFPQFFFRQIAAKIMEKIELRLKRPTLDWTPCFRLRSAGIIDFEGGICRLAAKIDVKLL